MGLATRGLPRRSAAVARARLRRAAHAPPWNPARERATSEQAWPASAAAAGQCPASTQRVARRADSRWRPPRCLCPAACSWV
eukprot:2182444-Alexandrium_andersonii.AAC.1